MRIEEYKIIRSEAKQYAENVLKNIPRDFTLVHLEVLKNLIPQIIDEKEADYKRKAIISFVDTGEERKEIAKQLERLSEEAPVTRYDVVSYCMGRYRTVDAVMWNVINELNKEGKIKD